MSQQTMWERVRTGGKTGFDKVWKAADKLGAPVNRLSNKLGSEAFWPTSLDKESDKCARILKSFCKDGFYAEEEFQPQEGPKQKQRVLKKIPEKVIQNAKGLCIFTTMRTGLWVSGSGGSGVLVARKADGTWSPPSGILLHTAGIGFLLGVDIYDCVIVINTEKALEAFQKVRCTLGSEISVAAGPVGAGGFIDTELHKRQAPVFTYMKSRGFYAGVQIEGTVIIERVDENERFYGERIAVQKILKGEARHPPYEVKRLMETLKAAQGDRNVDESMIPVEAPPGDYEIDDGHTFGVPDQDDPDPYGVLALEKEGMSLKEAGTKKRASWEEFSFNPSPTSPVHTLVNHRRSLSRRNSWRTSVFATTEPKSPSSLRNSLDMARPAGVMSDASTQTDTGEDGGSPNVRRVLHRHGSKGSIANTLSSSHMQEVPEDSVLQTEPERKEPASVSRANGYTTPPRTPPASTDAPAHGTKPELPPRDHGYDGDREEDDEGEDTDEEEPHIVETIVQPMQQFQTAQSVQTLQPTSPTAVTKARIVNVPKRIPPKLPPRNPNRSAGLAVDSSSRSDGRSSFESHGNTTEASETAKDVGTDPIEQKMEVVSLDDDERGAAKQDMSTQSHADGHNRAADTARMPGGFD